MLVNTSCEVGVQKRDAFGQSSVRMDEGVDHDFDEREQIRSWEPILRNHCVKGHRLGLTAAGERDMNLKAIRPMLNIDWTVLTLSWEPAKIRA